MEVTAPRSRKRPRFRRELILTAASKLFRDRGYHGVGLADIGEAVGVTGSAIYRHFARKDDLLIEIFNRAFDRYERDLAKAVASSSSPREVLERCVRANVAFTIEEPMLAAVYVREGRNLPPEERARIAHRQRILQAEVSDILRSVRPDLTAEQARTRLIAVFNGLIASIGYFQSRLDGAALQAELEGMAIGALLAP